MSKLNSVLSKVGFHAVYEKSIREATDLAFEYGFSSVQIETAMPEFFPEKYDIKTRRRFDVMQMKRMSHLKVHAPEEDFSLQTLYTYISIISGINCTPKYIFI